MKLYANHLVFSALTLVLFAFPAVAEGEPQELITQVGGQSPPDTPELVQERIQERWAKYQEPGTSSSGQATPLNLPQVKSGNPEQPEAEKEVKQVPSIAPTMPAAPEPSWDNKGASALQDEIEQYKTIVLDSKKQNIKPNKRQFVELSRNYVNRIHCSGTLETMIIPNDRGIEADLLNDNHDLFLRAAPSDIRSFPLDLSLICDGNVYLINAVVNPHVPSQDIVLELPQGVRPISEKERQRYRAGISASEALPLEEKLALIMQRIYKDDPLPYWKEMSTPTSNSRWNRGHYSVFLQKVTQTGISDLVVWDFIFRGSFPKTSIYDEVRKIVKGEIVAFGIVTYEGHSASRIIVTAKD